jgi:hypothetical protein
MRKRRDAVSGMWVRWRRALIWRARGVRGRILALHPLLDPHLLDGRRSPGETAVVDQRYTLVPRRGRLHARRARRPCEQLNRMNWSTACVLPRQ